MSMYIQTEKEYVKQQVDALKDLFNQKKGSSLVLRPDLIGHKYLTFHVIKVSPKTLHAYCFNRYGWWRQADHQNVVMKITRDDITMIKGDYNKSYYRGGNDGVGMHAGALRGFLSMGLIPNVGLKYLRKV